MFLRETIAYNLKEKKKTTQGKEQWKKNHAELNCTDICLVLQSKSSIIWIVFLQ